MDIRSEVTRFVVDNFLFGQAGDLRDEDSFLEKGIIDSTGILELIGFLEEHFGVAVQDSELIPENLDSIRNVAAFVQRRRGAVDEPRGVVPGFVGNGCGASHQDAVATLEAVQAVATER